VASYLRNVILGILFGTLMGCALGSVRSHAKDLGQWSNADPEIRKWYEDLRQPDMPAASCCGAADAYWADSFETSPDGEYVAIITDPRDDEPLKRQHIDIGTKIVVPNNKLNKDSNPTGHGIIFLSTGRYVYCYIAPGGV
jgi:hypothetical protein